MAKTLARLRAQIDELQRQADQALAKEKAAVVASLLQTIEQYRIAPEDLLGTQPAKRPSAKTASPAC